MGDENFSSTSSEAHENPKKKTRARTTRPPPKKVTMTPAQKEKNDRDRAEIETQLGGTPASKSSSGSQPAEHTPYRSGSIGYKLREHFSCVKREDGGHAVTCKLCTEKIGVVAGEGFGNIGKHYKRYHDKEYTAAGCKENHDRAAESREKEKVDHGHAEEDPAEALLHMVARLRLPFSIIDDKYFRRLVKEKGIKVVVDGEKTRLMSRNNISACMDSEKEKLLDIVLSKVSNKLVSVNMDGGTTQGVRTTAVNLHADGWSFPVKVLDCPLGMDGEDGRATAAKLEKDLSPFFDLLKEKYHLQVVSITTSVG